MNRWTFARVAIVIISEIDCTIMTISRMLMWRIASLMDRVWSCDTKIPFFWKRLQKSTKVKKVSMFAQYLLLMEMEDHFCFAFVKPRNSGI